MAAKKTTANVPKQALSKRRGTPTVESLCTHSVLFRLDGEWGTHDFEKLVRTLSQLQSLAVRATPNKRLVSTEAASQVMPWRGGFSVVNYFSALRADVPAELRPRIKRIRYSSPGIIEVLVGGAVVAGLMVRSIKKSAEAAGTVLDVLHKYRVHARELKLADIDLARGRVHLKKEQLEYIRMASKEIEQGGVIPAKLLDMVDASVQDHSLARLKARIAVLRRLEVLIRFDEEGLATLDEGE